MIWHLDSVQQVINAKHTVNVPYCDLVEHSIVNTHTESSVIFTKKRWGSPLIRGRSNRNICPPT